MSAFRIEVYQHRFADDVEDRGSDYEKPAAQIRLMTDVEWEKAIDLTTSRIFEKGLVEEIRLTLEEVLDEEFGVSP